MKKMVNKNVVRGRVFCLLLFSLLFDLFSFVAPPTHMWASEHHSIREGWHVLDVFGNKFSRRVEMDKRCIGQMFSAPNQKTRQKQKFKPNNKQKKNEKKKGKEKKKEIGKEVEQHNND